MVSKKYSVTFTDGTKTTVFGTDKIEAGAVAIRQSKKEIREIKLIGTLDYDY